LQEGENCANQIVTLEVNALGDVNVMVNSMNVVKGLNDMFLLDMNKDTGANDLTVDNDDTSDPNNNTNGIPNNNVDNDDGNNSQTMIAIAIAVPISLLVLVFGYQLFCHASDNVPAAGGRKSHNRAGGDNNNDLAFVKRDEGEHVLTSRDALLQLASGHTICPLGLHPFSRDMGDDDFSAFLHFKTPHLQD
jgi:hypothetical protein